MSNSGTNFPVYIYQENMILPDNGTYFLVAGNGLWLHKDMPTFKGFVPVENISVLPDLELESSATSKLPKLPIETGWKIKQLFREVVQKYCSEACTVLYYNHTINNWKVFVPKQVVSHGSVQYNRKAAFNMEGMEGYIPVGTIHSHADFNAFHSGTDERDEEYFDGLHVTFGHNHEDNISISATFVVNGQRFKLNPKDVLEGVAEVDGMYSFQNGGDVTEQVAEWMKEIFSYSRSKTEVKVGDKVLFSTFFKKDQSTEPLEVIEVKGQMVTVRVMDTETMTFPRDMFVKEGE